MISYLEKVGKQDIPDPAKFYVQSILAPLYAATGKHENSAHSYETIGDVQHLLHEYMELAKTSTDPIVIEKVADTLQEHGATEEASKLYGKAAKINEKESNDDWVSAAQAAEDYAKAGRPNQAIDLYGKALELSSHHSSNEKLERLRRIHRAEIESRLSELKQAITPRRTKNRLEHQVAALIISAIVLMGFSKNLTGYSILSTSTGLDVPFILSIIVLFISLIIIKKKII